MLTAHLPTPTTPFIGRSQELADIVARLADPDCHLLTLQGPGGIGKTRLALEVVKRFVQNYAPADGAHFVDLQLATSSDLLVMALTDTLGVLISGDEAPLIQLLRYLSGRNHVLLLDNFEQLLDRADVLADIISVASDVKLLVTSREALNLQEEWVWQVAGLEIPDEHSEAMIETYSAVQLFGARAYRIRKDFTIVGQEACVARICRLVEGMSLALELAAGWIKVLSCAEIANQLYGNLELLKTQLRNVPQRHQSMRAVFDHSWHLLTEAERQVFPRLTVFRGGFRREAAEQIAGASLAVLAGLVDKSFLRLNRAGRYEIHELMRQYGAEKLEAVLGTYEDARFQHCRYYASFLYQRQNALRGAAQGAVLDEIGSELDNVRASWLWAVEHDLLDEIHRSMHSLHIFCHIRARALEGERLFALAIKRFEDEDSATLAYLLLMHPGLSWFNGRVPNNDQYPRAIELAYRFWTTDEIAIPLRNYDYADAGVKTPFLLSDSLQARQRRIFSDFLEIFRQHHQWWGVSYMLYCLGEIYAATEQYAEAERYYRQSMDGFAQLGDRWAGCWPSMGLAWILENTQRYQAALPMWQVHQDGCAAVGDWGGVVYTLAQKSRVAWKLHDPHPARLYITQAIKSYLEHGSQFAHLYMVFQSLIPLLMSEGRNERAAELASFMRQFADTARATKVADETEQRLTTLAQELPPERYQQALERGKALHLRTILEQLHDELSGYSRTSETQPKAKILSERELEVLRLVAEGQSNRQIAHTLVLTLNTVKSHIHHLYGKLGVESRTQAVARARELHLL